LIMRPLARLGITPNTLTVLGLLLSIMTAGVIAQGFLFVGGLLVLFAGIFDMFDGALARAQNAATTFGAFFDSTLDRYSESIILFGLLWYTLKVTALHESLWPFPYEQSWMISLIYIAVVGSLMVSYTKARAEGLGLELKTGLLARPERVVILAIGLITGTVIWAMLLLAIFSNVTAVERIVHIWHATRQMQAVTSSQSNSSSTHNRPEPIETSEGVESSANVGAINRAPTAEEQVEKIEPSILPVHTIVPPFSGSVQQEPH
jgi:CDP-diacylglycerol--glycerol-3-phosphate 3-phosphatidyltransferase